jgi:glycosyltransferase involved in cell wall biosynthesis
MRFLMLNWRDPRNPKAGGAERVTLGYLAALARRGHEVFWFAPLFEAAQPQEIIAGIHIVREGRRIGSSILAARQWYRRQARFDLVIDQHHGVPWYAPWWCRANCVAYIHEVLGPIWNAFYHWPYNVLGRWQERWTHTIYRNVPFWTASQATKDSLRARGVRQVTIIPYGIETQAITKLDAKPLQLPLQLVAVSRLAPNKRVDHAVRALKALQERGVAAQLNIVGTGDSEAELRQLAKTLRLESQVVFTGLLPEDEKNQCLRRAHVLLHTSMCEGWGLNVIEANAMGTPAIVYPVAGLTESTLHGETGLVVPTETPEALAQGVIDLLSAPEQYQFFRHKAWERAKTFHWNHVLPPACAWLEQQAAQKP